MKITKHSLDHIELIASGDTALFEIRLIVAMNDWSDDEADAGFDEIGALGWLMNLLSSCSAGRRYQNRRRGIFESDDDPR
jgi:hypothetical protein